MNKTDNLVVFIDKKNINGKTHKHHVDRLAAGYNEGLALGQATLIKKADQAGFKRIGNSPISGNHRIFAGINDRNFAGMSPNQV